MAQLVSIMALSHAPGLTGWLDRAPPEQQRGLVEGYRELGRMLRASRPDVIVGFANDHILNLPPHEPPDFCVGTAPRWRGPAPWFRDWLNIEDYSLDGHPEVAGAIVREGAREGIDFASRDDLLFDDNWSVPLLYLTPEYDVPLVPVHMNCVVPPMPAPERCYEVGGKLARIVRDRLPDNLRVALLATGGMSHDPGGPKYFEIDEAFDRWFLGLLAEGDAAKVLREVTIDRMREAGDGGTPELLAWFVTLGAAGGGPAKVVCYEPTVALRCGMGGVVWDA